MAPTNDERSVRDTFRDGCNNLDSRLESSGLKIGLGLLSAWRIFLIFVYSYVWNIYDKFSFFFFFTMQKSRFYINRILINNIQENVLTFIVLGKMIRKYDFLNILFKHWTVYFESGASLFSFVSRKLKFYTKLSINYVISHFFKKWTYTTFKINGPYGGFFCIV